jgi:hypothetical protein
VVAVVVVGVMAGVRVIDVALTEADTLVVVGVMAVVGVIDVALMEAGTLVLGVNLAAAEKAVETAAETEAGMVGCVATVEGLVKPRAKVTEADAEANLVLARVTGAEEEANVVLAMEAALRVARG